MAHNDNGRRVGLGVLGWCVGWWVLGLGGVSANEVVIFQESNGFPGSEARGQELSLQQVTIRRDELRILDPSHGWALFMDAGEELEGQTGVVREAFVGSREYVERPFAFYERYREERAESLASQAQEFRQRLERVEDDAAARAELIEAYREIGGDPDQPGRVRAQLEHVEEDRRTLRILVDREVREVVAEHYRIRENTRTEPAFDIWTTTEVELPVNVLSFYQRVGTFGPEVNGLLEDVPGTVLRCRAVLDTGTFQRTFYSQVVEIRLEERVGPQDVRLPREGWEKVDPEERAAQEGEQEVVCAVTGERVRMADALRFRYQATGRVYYLKDSAARARLVQILARGEEPPYGGRQ